MKDKKISISIPNWLTFLLGGIILLRIPSFFEPFSYGDEMIYLTLGEGVRQGLVLYRDLHDNKPPFLYWLAALAGNVFWFRAILAAWMLATTIIFWKLTKVLFPKYPKLQQAATIAFGILTTLPLLEGNIANAEVFMIGLSITAIYILLKHKNTTLNLLLAGGLFSFAALFKIPAAFEVPVIVFYWLFNEKISVKNIILTFKKSLILGVGFLIPILITFLWYSFRGALPEYIGSAFLQNVGYLSSWRPDTVRESFLIRNGPLLLRAGIVLLGVFILYLVRKKISKTFFFTTLWLLFTLFAVTLSERPYPHYLIQAVPALSILLALFIYSPRFEQVLTLIPITLALAVPVYYKFYYYNTFSYYERFLGLASGKLNQEQYFDKFDGNVNRNYKIAKYVIASSDSRDKVFVWGDSPPVYALSHRLPPLKYVAGYHINDFSNQEEVLSRLEQNPPSLVVIMPDAPNFDKLHLWLREPYVKIAEIDRAQVWKRLKPEVVKIIK